MRAICSGDATLCARRRCANGQARGVSRVRARARYVRGAGGGFDFGGPTLLAHGRRWVDERQEVGLRAALCGGGLAPHLERRYAVVRLVEDVVARERNRDGARAPLAACEQRLVLRCGRTHGREPLVAVDVLGEAVHHELVARPREERRAERGVRVGIEGHTGVAQREGHGEVLLRAARHAGAVDRGGLTRALRLVVAEQRRAPRMQLDVSLMSPPHHPTPQSFAPGLPFRSMQCGERRSLLEDAGPRESRHWQGSHTRPAPPRALQRPALHTSPLAAPLLLPAARLFSLLQCAIYMYPETRVGSCDGAFLKAPGATHSALPVAGSTSETRPHCLSQ